MGASGSVVIGRSSYTTCNLYGFNQCTMFEKIEASRSSISRGWPRGSKCNKCASLERRYQASWTHEVSWQTGTWCVRRRAGEPDQDRKNGYAVLDQKKARRSARQARRYAGIHRPQEDLLSQNPAAYVDAFKGDLREGLKDLEADH